MSDDVTTYVRSRDGQLAYRVRGSGPCVALVVGSIPGLALLDDPLDRAFFHRLAGFCRFVVHDVRGQGRSDPLPPGHVPTVWEQADDLCAILDHAGCPDVILFGWHVGAAVGVAFAVRYPERTQGLFITNGWARLIQAEDYPHGITREVSDRIVEAHGNKVGTGMFADMFSPSRAGDPEVRAAYQRIEQNQSRAQATQLTRMAQEVDVRELLGCVRTPTVVMHSRDNSAVPVEHGRYLAAHVPGAASIEFAGTDHTFFLEDPEPVLIELEAFVTGNRPQAEPDYAFLTVVVADLVTSTEHLTEVGDRRWRELIDRYEHEVSTKTEAHGGRVVKTTGDGILAVFPIPSRAVRCAVTIAEASTRIGLQSRVGVHAGEVQLRDDDVYGIAVNIAARVCALAEPTEVLVTRTIKDLLGGTALKFTDRSVHVLKGVSDAWQLYRID
jgi:class 3 adenylate cyclase/pimeloyl-ACP methyl ester carboxylesterase